MVGEILKKRREELGHDLRDISNILKIKHDYLKAIEEGSFEKLPEPVYIKGYIRKYSEHLKIDPETTLHAYSQQVSSTEKREFPDHPVILQKRFKPRYAVIPAIFVVVVAVSLSVISSFTSKEPADTRNIPESQKQLSLPAEPAQNTPDTVPQSQPSPEPSQVPANTVIPGPETAGKTLPADHTPHTLEVKATDITWFSVRIDEKNPREITTTPGETLKFHAEKAFSLTIGNAGGVKLIFNGKEVRKLGEKGEVVKITLPESRL